MCKYVHTDIKTTILTHLCRVSNPWVSRFIFQARESSGCLDYVIFMFVVVSPLYLNTSMVHLILKPTSQNQVPL